MTTLYEQIEEAESKLKELNNPEQKPDEVEEDIEEEEVEEEADELADEDDKDDVEEVTKEELEEKEQKPDASAYARMRREKRELEERIRALEEAKEPKKEVVNTDPEPSKQEDYEQWLEWKDRQIEKKVSEIEAWKNTQEQSTQQKQLWEGAIKEFQHFENEFQKKTPDYEDASEFMKKRLYDSISLTNDDLSPAQVNQKITDYILKTASKAAADGYNPAETLYRLSKDKFGFVKESPQEKVAKPDLRKIDANRKKSASPLQSGGKSGSVSISKESIADMSMAEFAKLTPSQLRELESQ